MPMMNVFVLNILTRCLTVIVITHKIEILFHSWYACDELMIEILLLILFQWFSDSSIQMDCFNDA